MLGGSHEAEQICDLNPPRYDPDVSAQPRDSQGRRAQRAVRRIAPDHPAGSGRTGAVQYGYPQFWRRPADAPFGLMSST